MAGGFWRRDALQCESGLAGLQSASRCSLQLAGGLSPAGLPCPDLVNPPELVTGTMPTFSSTQSAKAPNANARNLLRLQDTVDLQGNPLNYLV